MKHEQNESYITVLCLKADVFMEFLMVIGINEVPFGGDDIG